MDIEKERRLRLVRVALLDTLMALAVVAIVTVLVLIVSGYRFNEDMSLEQSGLVRVTTIPSGATVEIDGETQSAKTEMSRMLSEGEHGIYITKDGYESWSNKVKITPGWLLRLNYVRLIKQNRKQEEVKQFDELRFLTAAPDRSRLLYMTDNTDELQLLDITEETVKTDTLKFNFDLGAIQDVIWNRACDRLVLKSIIGEQTAWILVNLENPDKSKNLTETWGINFQKILPFNDNYYALSGNGLYEINGTDYSTTEVLIGQIMDFYNYEDKIVYAKKDDQGVTLGINTRGTQKVIQTLKTANTIKVALLRDVGKDYPVFVIDNHLYVYNNENKAEVVANDEITIVPESLDVAWNHQLLVMRKDTVWVVYNIETNDYTTYDKGVVQLDWIDDYMMAGVIDDRLVIWDYDGTNQHILSAAVAGYDTVIAKDNHWIYYVAQDTKTQQLVLRRESL